MSKGQREIYKPDPLEPFHERTVTKPNRGHPGVSSLLTSYGGRAQSEETLKPKISSEVLGMLIVSCQRGFRHHKGININNAQNTKSNFCQRLHSK